MNSNLLKDKYPEIFKEIDIEKTLQENPGLNINELTCGSKRNIWFTCNKGHSYRTKMYGRMHNAHCPVCYGRYAIPGETDLETFVKNHPEYQFILDEWDYDKNTIKPSEIKPNSNKKIYLICKKGHCHSCRLAQLIFSKKSNCPYCTNQKVLTGYNDLETWCHKNNREDILKDWDYEKNTVKPSEILHGSHKKYWFKCNSGHEYQQEIYLKTKLMCGCPKCFSARHRSTQELLFYELCKEYVDANSQNGIKIHEWEIDVFIKSLNLCMEYDGIRFHNSEESKERERRKNIAILSDKFHNYKMIRIKETEDLEKLNLFHETIDGVEIYYIKDAYNDNYFSSVNKIILDLFNIDIPVYKIKDKYNDIKLNITKKYKDRCKYPTK